MKAGLMLGVNPDFKREENDFYATDPYSLKLVLPLLEDLSIINKDLDTIIECSAGNGHLSEVLKSNFYKVKTCDIVERDYKLDIVKDFLKTKREDFISNNNNNYISILTNPPFKYASDFIEHSMEILKNGETAIFFLKVQFLETTKRKLLFEKYPPKYIIVNSERIACAMNGEFDKYFKQDKKTKRYSGGTQMYCWYVFEKGYRGNTYLKWI